MSHIGPPFAPQVASDGRNVGAKQLPFVVPIVKSAVQKTEPPQAASAILTTNRSDAVCPDAGHEHCVQPRPER